jgi:putative membrane protein
MLQHILLMNVLVPVCAFATPKRFRPRHLWRSWPWATAAQMILLWGWHSPGILSAATGSFGLMLVMHLTLIAVAAWFWLAVATMPREGTWRAVFALLFTAKLSCLLGALLVFAPNALFRLGNGTGHHGNIGVSALDDQQLAGMLMLIACPLTYVAVGIVLAGRWIVSLDQGSANG